VRLACIDSRQQRQGPAEVRSAEGNRLATENYRDDQLDGVQTSYFSTGKVREMGTWKQGQRDGAWDTFDSSGARLDSSTYAAGVRQGAYTRWYANGQKAEAGSYNKGDKQGLWTEWSEAGDVVATTLFDHGTEVPSATSSQGKPEVVTRGMPFGGQPIEWWQTELNQARANPARTARYQLLRRRAEANHLEVKEGASGVTVVVSAALAEQILQRRRSP
jgi:hypothetical protein